jgi:hypothetical protein
MCGVEEQCVQAFGSVGLATDRRVLKWIFKKPACDGEDWTHLAHDRDRWQALVNTVVDI